MDRLIDGGAVRAWAPRAFAEFSQTHPLHAVGTRGLPWIEIDFPEDYQRAVRDVLPRIESEPLLYPRHRVAAAWDGRTNRRVARDDRRGLALADRQNQPMLADAS